MSRSIFVTGTKHLKFTTERSSFILAHGLADSWQTNAEITEWDGVARKCCSIHDSQEREMEGRAIGKKPASGSGPEGPTSNQGPILDKTFN